MFLAIDVGNTNIVFGLFKEDELIGEWRLATDLAKSGDRYHESISSIIELGNIVIDAVEKVVICSVVPEVTNKLKPVLENIFKNNVLVMGDDFIAPIDNLYKSPDEVGQDRLANAVAVKELYKTPAIIVDFGTAITFDVLSKKGEYLGGVIAPGIKLTLDSLANKTALLPQVKLTPPENLIGSNTIDSIKSGTFYGISDMCNGLIKRLKKKVPGRVQVIATGGHTAMLKREIKSIDIIDPHLTIKGIKISFQKNT